VGAGDVSGHARAQGMGTEEAARELRYAFLERTAAEQSCTAVATAHHAEDNAETVLMNLARGSGLRGLCGIPPVRGIIVRPLLQVTRAEIEAYLAEKGIPFVEDSSNSGDFCFRNRVRHRVLPVLSEGNPGAAAHISAAAESLREDEAFLSGLAEEFLRSEYRDNSLPVGALLAQPPAVGKRALRILCPRAEAVHIGALLALCRSEKPAGAADLPGMRVRRAGDFLQFGPAAEPIPVTELRPGTGISLGEWQIDCTETLGEKEIHNSFNTFFFKCEKICGRMFVASKKEGDSVRLLGRGCSKTLKKLYQEKKLSPDSRTRNPVFYDEAGVAAVYGFGMAERLAAQPGDRVLRVTVTQKKSEDKDHGRTDEG